MTDKSIRRHLAAKVAISVMSYRIQPRPKREGNTNGPAGMKAFLSFQPWSTPPANFLLSRLNRPENQTRARLFCVTSTVRYVAYDWELVALAFPYYVLSLRSKTIADVETLRTPPQFPPATIVIFFKYRIENVHIRSDVDPVKAITCPNGNQSCYLSVSMYWNAKVLLDVFSDTKRKYESEITT